MHTAKKAVWWVIALAILLVLIHPLLPDQITFQISQTHPPLVVPVGALFKLLWSNLVTPVANFIDRNVSSLISWPLAIVATTLLVLQSELARTLLLTFAGRIKSFDMFGFSVDLNEQIKELRRESDDLFRLLPSVRANVAKELRVRVKEMNIEPTFIKLAMQVGDYLGQLSSKFDPRRCRATIHIEDPLFPDQLMQLLEYVTPDGTLLPGSNAGRSFSIRRGIVGQVWRSNIPEVAGVLPAKESSNPDPNERARHIARIWGMTVSEAHHAGRYPSCISVPFAYGEKQRAVFYMDSTLENAFVDDSQKDALIATIGSMVGQLRLDAAIGDIVRSMTVRSINMQGLESVGAQ